MLSGPGQSRVGERHAHPALVRLGERDQAVVDLEDGIARDERGGVPVRPEPRWTRSKCSGSRRRRRRRPLRGRRPRPAWGRLGPGRRPECVVQVVQVAVGVVGRCHSLVHLVDDDRLPRDASRRQLGEHRPGRVTTADGEVEAPVRPTASDAAAATKAAPARATAAGSAWASSWCAPLAIASSRRARRTRCAWRRESCR